MKSQHPMFALLRKDWGLNRAPIYGGLGLIASPYFIATLFAMGAHDPLRVRAVSFFFTVAAVMGGLLTIMLAAVFGGAALALERRERSADFLAMMPVSRVRIVASKLILATFVLSALWGINFAAFAIARSHGYYSSASAFDALPFSSAGLLMLFGVAWLCSSFLSSPAVAACISIGIGCTAIFWPALLPSGVSSSIADSDIFEIEFLGSATVGLVALAIGTFHYLDRVEP